MPDKRREDEKRRREAAQSNTAEVEEGGYEVAGRSIKQMVSVRLEAQLLKELRQLAEPEQQHASISDLLRQAAVELVEHRRTTPVVMMLRPAGGPQVIPSALTTGVTFGVPNEDEDPQIPFSGSTHQRNANRLWLTRVSGGVAVGLLGLLGRLGVVVAGRGRCGAGSGCAIR